MRRTALPPFSMLPLALALALALALPAMAAEPFLTLPDESPEPVQVPAKPQVEHPQPPPSHLPHTTGTPTHMDQELAREHQRFTQFATEQVHRMNANILGGKHSMHVEKHGNGKYRARYKAIDVEGIVCQVRRSESNPKYYVGSVLYTEHTLESVAHSPEACRKGEFVRVSEKQNRIIYSSKHGGGWQ